MTVVHLLSHVHIFSNPWTAAHQDSLSFTITQSSHKCMSIELVMLSNHLILCCSILFLPSIFPSIRVFSNESALHISQSIRASASVLLVNIKGWFPLGLTGCISLLSKELSMGAPQFESMNSSVLSLLYGSTLTSVCDYWKNHSSDYPDFFFKVTSLLFNTLSGFVIVCLPKEQASFNFVAAVTIHSDFGSQENKICHSSMFSLSLPGSDGRVCLTSPS